ncbi:HutD family protein [Acinetobacter baumannii]|uniref:HutD/Ves family protein n=1 Tax=Acinetobacter baumannii TaxID=470 RepID=UPI001B8F9FF2|nr:HutD family protein [Acinetobacter baumannii]MBR8606864.1 HutD family protein [Acinetobacter baumannii]MCF4466660.1 HutD family protein [Acinetobacter baumannii]MCF4504334.1 HutD family protein [Acinetobacter baumannii]MCF4514941.1 HutD family protein [Acinetobacter baumannii]MCF4535744.1 HutD family protein [Acinetobacter baumannii]
MIELIRADQYTKMLWKNGAGFTLEIARSQGDTDFEWRISMADVSTSGPFSLFPNKQRIISVLEGHGMVLHVDDLPAKTLNQGDIFAFHGESQVQSELVDGAIRDLNLIYDPAKFHARFQWLNDAAEQVFISSADLIFIFNQGGETQVKVDDHSVQLTAHETLKIERNAGVTSISFPKKQLKSCYVIELIQR